MEKERIEPIVKKFYDGVAEGHYYGRKCPECGAIEFPPHLMCNSCGGLKTEWVELTGHGHLLSFITPGVQNDKPYLKAEGKYGYGAVQLDEGPIYTFVVFGAGKKQRAEINARIQAGEIIGVHPRVVEREGWHQLCFELD
ncbi:hypothetical protein KPC83_04780 [Collinsella sp. zg1085]|uniref:zinc ribbon domain-containing protein n=1 Tax=Collinsella sp. zg1085 TaxID=2844380 RepID=UPI001C0D897A|nr:hypothetical protein [Collinsella sp. zg1085]QWT17164.1 hypothetical protein KPC83_04780 [Collinsella sp. zg1085]